MAAELPTEDCEQRAVAAVALPVAKTNVAFLDDGGIVVPGDITGSAYAWGFGGRDGAGRRAPKGNLSRILPPAGLKVLNFEHGLIGLAFFALAPTR
jgi:hypothetical protein